MEIKKLHHLLDFSEAVLVTHRGCSDGSGCALMFLAAGGRRENILYAIPNRVEQFVQENRLLELKNFIIFADLTFGDCIKQVVDDLEKRGNCVIIDHHKSSIWLQDRTWCHINMDHCGTELMRQYFELDGAHFRRYASMVDDVDRWVEGRDSSSDDLATYHSFVGQEDYITRFTKTNLWQRAHSCHGFMLPGEHEIVSILNRRREEAIASALDRVIIKTIDVDGALVQIGYSLAHTGNPSLLLHRVLEKYKDQIQVAASFNIDQGTVSLRSLPGFDCAAMAQFFCPTGGGHPCAAGHDIPPGVIDDFVSSVHGV
jgi:oligoribonuclease NrnB/cAMP/cGMP phosphodiesterase (DHH superfamily)